MVTSEEPGISEHKEGQFHLRAFVKTGRRQETIRVASNTIRKVTERERRGDARTP